MTMKSNGWKFLRFTAILVVLSTVKADIRRDCRKQTHVSWASLKKLNSGDLNQEDPKLKCYVRCFMIKSGILTNKNQVNLERALRHLPRNMQEPSRKIFERCKSIQGTNACDKAYQIAKCYIKAQPDILKNVSFV